MKRIDAITMLLLSMLGVLLGVYIGKAEDRANPQPFCSMSFVLDTVTPDWYNCVRIEKVGLHEHP